MTVLNIPRTALEVRKARHAVGDLTLDHFEVTETPVPEPGEGEVLVRADYVQLMIAIKDMMSEQTQQPLAPWRIGDPVGMGGVGTVVHSNSPVLADGDLVRSTRGWCEYWTGPAEEFVRLEPGLLPSPVHHLSQGTTAYYGMADIARVGAGDVVFVSGAAGGVGSLAGQIAKCLGAAKVIGSTGSKAKVGYLVDELGFDAAFDYHDGPVLDQLRRLAPEGITVFFDNVGGEQFTAAVEAAAPHARFALCGVLANQVGGTGSYLLPLDVMEAGLRLLRILPFACRHTPAQNAAWTTHLGQWLAEDRFVFPHTVVEGGIEAAPRALLSLLGGGYRGNVTVRVSNGK